MINLFTSLYLLQVRATDFQFGGQKSTQNNTVAIIVIIVIFLAVIIVINFARKSPGGGGSGKFLSGLNMRRMARNAGLSHEQIKMLNFVFKTDDVVDPEKSLANPSLLDRHFRRAYRVIGQNSSNLVEAQRKHALLFSTRNILENSSIGKISSTLHLKEDTVLNLSAGKDKLKVVLVSIKNDCLMAETPKNALGSQIKIPKGTRMNVLFFTKSNKGFTFESRVIGYTTLHGHPVMQLAHSNNLKFLSQRRFRRRSCAIACNMNLVYVEGSGKKQRLVVDKRQLKGTILDISVGGCSIKTTMPVQVGSRFKIEYSMDESNVAALGQVLRSNRTGINTIIHIKFIKVTLKSMNLINAFVYDFVND